MDEEALTSGDRGIQLSPEEYQELERALQWPEDLAEYDKAARPTNLKEIGF